MLETGTLTATEFLPKFAEALQASVNGALPAAEKSARAQLQRLENAFTEFKLRIASSGLLDKVAEQLERLLAHIGSLADSGELDRLATGFAEAFGKAVTLMADAAIMAERFAGVFVVVGGAMASAAVGARLLGTTATAAAVGTAAAGTAAVAAAPGIGLFAAALRLIPGLAVGAAILWSLDKLVEWGAGRPRPVPGRRRSMRICASWSIPTTSTPARPGSMRMRWPSSATRPLPPTKRQSKVPGTTPPPRSCS